MVNMSWNIQQNTWNGSLIRFYRCQVQLISGDYNKIRYKERLCNSRRFINYPKNSNSREISRDFFIYIDLYTSHKKPVLYIFCLALQVYQESRILLHSGKAKIPTQKHTKTFIMIIRIIE